MTKIPNFENSRWWKPSTAAIFENSFIAIYLSQKSSDFNEIWYADCGKGISGKAKIF